MGKTKLQPGKVKHRPLGRHQHRQKHNTEMNQNKVGKEGVDWINVT
jgi:hypothetical protein